MEKRARSPDARTYGGIQASKRGPTRVRQLSETPVDLDKHRGMAAQKATDIRRVLADVEANAKLLRDRQAAVEIQLLAVPATSWPEAAAKARYVLNLYAAQLAPADTHHRDLVAAVLADFTPLARGACARRPYFSESKSPHAFDESSNANRKHPMQNLSPRHVKTEE